MKKKDMISQLVSIKFDLILSARLSTACRLPDWPQNEGPQQSFRGTFPYIEYDRMECDDVY